MLEYFSVETRHALSGVREETRHALSVLQNNALSVLDFVNPGHERTAY